MKHKFIIALTGFIVSMTLALMGCAHAPDQDGLGDVRVMVRGQAGPAADLIDDTPSSPSIERILNAPLTEEACLELALINNPSIQFLLADLGIAAADVTEALTLSNPRFSIQARFPSGDASGTNLEFQAVQNILEFLMYPARKRLALEEFEQAKRRVTMEILTVAAQTRKAWWEAAAAENILHLRQTQQSAAEVSAELAHRQTAAGTANELFQAQRDMAREEAGIAHRAARLDSGAAHIRLSRLMGLDQTTSWTLAAGLPGLPIEDVQMDDEALQEQALARRLELINVRRESALLAEMIAVKSRWRWIPFLDVGANAERELDGQWVAGPVLEFEIPLFNRDQAGLKRLKALARKNQHHIRELELDIAAEVRLTLAALTAHRDTVLQFENQLIPLQEQNYQLTREHYYFMLKDTYDLLEARDQQWEGQARYITALRDYWMARADLEQALGMRLPAGEQRPLAPPESSKPPAAPSHQHQHH